MYVYKKKIFIVLFGVIDAVGSILSRLLNLFLKKKKISVKKILLIRIDHIGDVVESTCVTEPLRRAFPDAVIDFMAPSWGKGILENNPDIDNVIAFDPAWFSRDHIGFSGHLKSFYKMIKIIKAGGYDTAIDFRGDVRHITAIFLGGVKQRISYGITGGGFLLTHNVNYEADRHELDNNINLLKPLGINCTEPKPKLIIPEAGREKAGKIKKEKGLSENFAVLHMVPGHSAKKWTKEGFRECIRFLTEDKKMKAVIVGGESDKTFSEAVIEPFERNVIDLCGETDIGTLGALLEDAFLFIGVDSGPSHIAAAMEVPGVILFSGENDPDKWAPRSGQIKVIYPGKNKHLEEVSPEEVCKAIEQMLR